VGCNHTEPFTTDYRSVGPLVPGNPTRLTYNSGVDTRASWLPDGSAFLYTQQQTTSDQDQCLAVMGRTGGATSRLICTDTDPAQDSTNVFLAPAVSTNLRMAYVRTSTIAHFGRTTPDYGALVLATYALPLPGKQIVPLPHFSPGGQSVTFASDLHWTDPTTLYFLADRFQFTCLNTNCTIADTSIVGLEIDRVITTDTPSITLVTGTVGASALATAGSDTLYYALFGSGDLHRLIISTSTDSVVFTFPDNVLGLSAASGRVAAAVAGSLHLLILATAVDSILPAAGPLQVVDHPALDPTGHLLVADVRDGGAPSDLWLWSIP
jgi:hypothetical protein